MLEEFVSTSGQQRLWLQCLEGGAVRRGAGTDLCWEKKESEGERDWRGELVNSSQRVALDWENLFKIVAFLSKTVADCLNFAKL